MKPSRKPRRKSGIPVSWVEEWSIKFVGPKDLLRSPQCPLKTFQEPREEKP